jgi:hypothetical protein
MEGETSGHHEAPAEKCHCGIYGTLNLAHLMSQYPHDAANIVTVIAAEGNTILGSRGLRTAYARVVGYWSPVPEIRSIAERQFYDARFFEDIDEMLAHFELPTGWPDQEDAFTVELMTGERLTAPTPQQIAKAYTNALGGESTWVTLRNGGKAVGGPMESKLKTGALGSVTWEEVEIPVEPFNGEVMVCMSAGPDEPVVDMVSVGHFTFTDKGSIHISPKFNVTFG